MSPTGGASASAPSSGSIASVGAPTFGAVGRSLLRGSNLAAQLDASGRFERSASQKKLKRVLERVLERSTGCFGRLSDVARKVVILRVGTGGARPLSRRQVAARLDVSSTRVANLEQDAVRDLRRLNTSDECSTGAGVAGDAGAGDSRSGSGGATTGGADIRSAGGSQAALGSTSGAADELQGEVAGARASGSNSADPADQTEAVSSLWTPFGTVESDSGSIGIVLILGGLAGLTALVLLRAIRRQRQMR